MMIGKILAGRYQIISKLGEGGFGTTYLAIDSKLPDKDQCVVKHFSPKGTDLNTLSHARRLFETEAKVLNRLGNHDRVPRLLAHFEEDQNFYLVQEFIAGYDLSREIKVIYTLEEDEINIKRLQVWMVKDHHAYIITYTADVAKYSEYFQTAQTMINSLEIN